MHITWFYLFSSSVTNITLITLILLTWWALWVWWAPWLNLCKRCLLVVLHYQYYLYYMYRMRLFVQSLYYHITGITRLPFSQKHWFCAPGLAIPRLSYKPQRTQMEFPFLQSPLLLLVRSIVILASIEMHLLKIALNKKRSTDQTFWKEFLLGTDVGKKSTWPKKSSLMISPQLGLEDTTPWTCHQKLDHILMKTNSSLVWIQTWRTQYSSMTQSTSCSMKIQLLCRQ